MIERKAASITAAAEGTAQPPHEPSDEDLLVNEALGDSSEELDIPDEGNNSDSDDDEELDDDQELDASRELADMRTIEEVISDMGAEDALTADNARVGRAAVTKVRLISSLCP